MPPDQRDRWLELFKDFDHDHSGLLEYSEFEAGVRRRMRLGHDDLSDATLKSLWNALDVDGS
jgi:Ca2+-binding EF-hand superfamily protein